MASASRDTVVTSSARVSRFFFRRTSAEKMASASTERSLRAVAHDVYSQPTSHPVEAIQNNVISSPAAPGLQSSPLALNSDITPSLARSG